MYIIYLALLTLLYLGLCTLFKLSIGKLGHAQATWQEGVDNITNYCDAGTALQLIGCIASLKKKKDEKGKIVTPDCNVKLDAVETDTQACSRSQSSSSNKSMSVEVPCIEKQEGPSDHSKGAADAIAALGGKRRNVGIEQLKIIENHFIGYHSNQIHPEIIKVAVIVVIDMRVLQLCVMY